METRWQDSELFREYAELVHGVQQVLREDRGANPWQERYAGYMEAIQKNLPIAETARKTFPDVPPFHCYTKIGNFKWSNNDRPDDFDLRFLGQSVGTLEIRDGKARLVVDAGKGNTNREHFGCTLGPIEDDWPCGEQARRFRKDFKDLVREDKILKPRQVEHMVESALFSELGKMESAAKELTGIQPVTIMSLGNTRFHMKTALSASELLKKGTSPRLARGNGGGEIDIFCRWRRGNHSRLTVIELKKDSKIPFQRVLRQAIAYAVFIRELARSASGAEWMRLWRPHNKPWQGESFIINAVAAMPMPLPKPDLSFAGMRLPVEGGGPTDFIELHWLGLTEADPENRRAGREGHAGKGAQPVRFETSLGISKSSLRN